jgi:hypothetical protein
MRQKISVMKFQMPGVSEEGAYTVTIEGFDAAA